MFDFFKRLLGKEPDPPDFGEEEFERDYEAKKAGLERLLGPLHDLVGHALIPYHMGGPVDMYYFTKGLPGTAFVTMELVDPDGTGPQPNRVGTYELVAFTKHAIENVRPEDDDVPLTPFVAIERRMCGIFTMIGHYSTEAVLNPGDTCEVPTGESEEDEEYACVLFDEYTKDGCGLEYSGRRHCLLLCIEIFPEEMEFARQQGSAALLSKLKDAGHYPYSDLDRQSVV